MAMCWQMCITSCTILFSISGPLSAAPVAKTVRLKDGSLNVKPSLRRPAYTFFDTCEMIESGASTQRRAS